MYMQPAYYLQKCDFEKLISVTFFMKMIFKEELDLPSSCHYHVIILITKNVDNTYPPNLFFLYVFFPLLLLLLTNIYSFILIIFIESSLLIQFNYIIFHNG
jgi:hypothetical protein